MATLTKKGLLEAIKCFLCYIKRPFCSHKHQVFFKSIENGTMTTVYYKCSNCGKVHQVNYYLE